jgi:hypothetical protein
VRPLPTRVPSPGAVRAGGVSPGPLRLVAVTVARLDATSGWRRVVAGPSGDGWVWLDRLLADPAALDDWFRTELDGTARGHADLAGALIAYRLAGSLAELTVGTLFAQRRVLPLTPDRVALRVGEAARLDALGVSSPGVLVLPDDDAAEDPAAEVVSRPGDLRAAAADALVAVFDPVAEAVRTRAPFGRRGLWGTLADHVAEVAVRRARDAGGDADSAWRAASALLEALAERAPVFTRPRRQEVDARSGARTVVVKGTCCLIYKAGAPVGDRGAAARLVGRDACTSCPLRPEADRARRFRVWLDQR